MKIVRSRHVWLATLCALMPTCASAGTAPANLPSRQVLVSLMTGIAARFTHQNPLAPAVYKYGDWSDVKTSVMPRTAYWSYPTGATLMAMQRVYDITGDRGLLDYIIRNNQISAEQYAYLWWETKTFGQITSTGGFGKLWRLDMLDDCGAMGAEMLDTVLERHVRFTPPEVELINTIGQFVTQRQPRLADGTFWRPASDLGPTIWADDAFQGIPFLLRWSKYTHDSQWRSDAARQLIGAAHYLQDSDGLWFHGYFVDEHKLNGYKWGRGDGWVAIALADTLDALPATDPQYPAVLDLYRKMMAGLKKSQRPSGMWTQVLDHPELSWGEETSCTAAFAYAIACGLRRGWLPADEYGSVLRGAVAGLQSHINPDGEITGVCKSSSIGRDLNYYNARPKKDDDPHGFGLVLLALTETWAISR